MNDEAIMTTMMTLLLLRLQNDAGIKEMGPNDCKKWHDTVQMLLPLVIARLDVNMETLQ
jgi:hypothetical protein